MKPIFRVIANGADITETIKERLLKIQVTDAAGHSSDSVEIRIDDRDGKIVIPETGAKLEVFLGYEEQGLERVGIYTVDEIGLEGPSDTLIIPAKAADMKKNLKVPKSRSWDAVTFSDIVNTLAAEHGLKAKVSDDLAAILFTHLDQTNESDLHFLTRLAKQHDATVKPVMDFLVLVPRGEAKSISGATLSATSIVREDLNSWNYRSTNRGKYKAVAAHWNNTNTASKERELVGSGEPVFTIRRPFKNADEAKRAANAKRVAFERGAATLSLTLSEGKPSLQAEGKVTVSGVRDRIDADWTITKVVHDFSKSGFTTRLEAETPK